MVHRHHWSQELLAVSQNATQAFDGFRLMVVTKRGVFSFFAVLASTLFALSCQGSPGIEDEDFLESFPEYQEAWPRPDPPRVPERFDVMTLDAIPETIELLPALAAGGAGTAERRRLATLYRSEGYHGAALFFENTARIADGEVIDPRPVESPVSWTTWADAELERPREVAQETWRLTLDGRYREAIEYARVDIDGHGPSNQVVVQWAHAVLSAVGVPDQSVGEAEVEAAVRLFLTAIEEYDGVYPRGQPERPYAHSWLAATFIHRGDRLSALTAMALALVEDAQLPPDHGAKLSEFTREHLCHELPVLQKELGLSDRWWPDNHTLGAICSGY